MFKKEKVILLNENIENSEYINKYHKNEYDYKENNRRTIDNNTINKLEHEIEVLSFKNDGYKKDILKLKEEIKIINNLKNEKF